MTAICSTQAALRLAKREPLPDRALAGWQQWIQRPSATATNVAHGRVLLISYQFPPIGGSGVQRPAKLVKYLPECGWSVEVLTADHDRFPWADNSLLQDLPEEILAHHVAGREPACVARCIASLFGSSRRIEDGLFWRLARWTERVGLGNGESLWVGPAVKAAVRRHQDVPFDAVISTGPPHFVHRAAMRFAAATGVPWLADLRDPLVSDYERQSPSRHHIARMRRFERDILQRAGAIVTTCPTFAADLQERYPDRQRDIRSIANGFDRDDILNAVSPQDITNANATDVCEFVAVGSFYGRRELARIINPLQHLLAQRPQWHGRVRLTVAGTLDAEQQAYWQQNRPAWLSLAGYVSHAEAIRTAATGACSIVMVPGCEHGHMSIPGKTFELLALPTHILALVPPCSDTARIVRRAGASTVTAMENEHAVQAALCGIIESQLAGQLECTREWRKVNSFDRRVIAARFADSLNSITSQKSAEVLRREAEVA